MSITLEHEGAYFEMSAQTCDCDRLSPPDLDRAGLPVTLDNDGNLTCAHGNSQGNLHETLGFVLGSDYQDLQSEF